MGKVCASGKGPTLKFVYSNNRLLLKESPEAVSEQSSEFRTVEFSWHIKLHLGFYRLYRALYCKIRLCVFSTTLQRRTSALVTDKWMSMPCLERYWQRKTEVLERKTCPRVTFYQKSNMHWPWIESETPRWMAVTSKNHKRMKISVVGKLQHFVVFSNVALSF
jgi:hypothetical protein